MDKITKMTTLLAMLIFPMLGRANCPLVVRGYITDIGSGLPLENVNIFIGELNTGTHTDHTGYFQFIHLCVGSYHITFSHINCEARRLFIYLKNDTSLNIGMEHSKHELEEITIEGNPILSSTQNSETIYNQTIQDGIDKSLADLTESITGVSSLKNGSGISKPIIHGLYGNRITILNNGIAQSGQQWGNDHSPEIDPQVAGRIKVIKGSSALEFPGSNLGSIILIEPKRIEIEPHLHGTANYFFASNGLSNGINVQMGKFNPILSWKVYSTIQKSGDNKSASYFLNNTGSENIHLALQLEKNLSDQLNLDIYASTYNTKLGVLRGSHIGNLTDLEEAFMRKVPFFTEDNFSYAIEAPKQQVNHHLFKLNAKYFLDDRRYFDFTVATQLNDRKEFDIRRSGRSNIPSLDIRQYSFFFENKFYHDLNDRSRLKTGIQFNMTDNTNNPETGILPLIPDYLSYETGIFCILNHQKNKSNFETGLRYNVVNQNVAAISRTLPRKIIRYNQTFNNINASGGWKYTVNNRHNVSYNLGFATRNPAINELYSYGLHQGVSGIEEGNIHLQTEKSVKSTVGFVGKLKETIAYDFLFYYQHINNYIFLQPAQKTRLTIRGAFPVFNYNQTHAQIYGLDFASTITFTKSLITHLSYSFIRGNSLSDNTPLIYIPPNNITASIDYEFLSKRLENTKISIENKYVFQQNHTLLKQDFTPPPPGYYLIGIKLSTNLQISKIRIRTLLKIDNLLNTSYRDYLNRLRYFSDELGINAALSIILKF